MVRDKPTPKRVTIFVVLLTTVASLAHAAGPPVDRMRPGELIVRFQAGTAPVRETKGEPAQQRLAFRPARELWGANEPASLKKLAARLGLREGRALSVGTGDESGAKGASGARAGDVASVLDGVWLLRFEPGVGIDELIEAYESDPHVLNVEPNHEGSLFLVPSDPLYDQTSADLSLIGIEAAWDAQPGADPSVVVAVIDSGVDATHPDLASALDLTRSFNVTDNTDQIFDDLDHGTRVAGIIGAGGGNGEGIAGVAFGCTLVSLDVADDQGAVTVADVVTAIDLAVAGGVGIINMSLGFRSFSATLEATCQTAADAGTLLVASAGNEGQGDVPVYPASLRSVVGVGALTDDGVTRASWSNFNGLDGSLVELAAPGTTVFSTIPGAQYNGTFGSGTSFAAPMAAGTAALLMSHLPAQSAGAVRNHLRATADAPEAWSGHGRLNAAAALTTPLTPEIRVEEVLINDDPGIHSGNDNDGRLDHGETAHLTLGLVNSGGDVFGLSGTIQTADEDLMVSNPESIWGDAPFNENDLPYLTVPHAAAFQNVDFQSEDPMAKTVAFSLDLIGNDGAWSETISFTIETENAINPPAIIAADTMWWSETTYSIQSNTVVMPAATLTIEPGTRIEFDQLGGLEIRGGIDASGLEGEQITLTSSSDSDKPRGGFDFIGLGVGQQPLAAAVGDFDNDGDNDILAPNVYVDTTTPTDLSCLIWNGSGFDPEIRKDVGNINRNISNNLLIVDVDDDGTNEVIYSGRLFHYIEGEFTQIDTLSAEEFRAARDAHPSITNGQWNSFTYVGDVDNDGDNDITTNNQTESTIEIKPWNGTAFDPLIKIPIDEAFPEGLTIGDADNDGDNDLLVTYLATNIVSLIRWNGTGFDPQLRMESGVLPLAVTVGDADNDGDNDILTANGNEGFIYIYRWNGSGYSEPLKLGMSPSPAEGSISVTVADATNDGLNDLVTAQTPMDKVLVYAWDPLIEGLSRYRGVFITPTASLANFSHCHFQFAPVLDESSVGQFSDCVFERSAGAFGLSSTNGTNPIVRCRVTDNDRGVGIRAGAKGLVSCIAERNAGEGLIGGSFFNCSAFDNGGHGIAGNSAEGCHAEKNQRAGISVQDDAVDCIVRLNWNNGLTALGDVTGCLAQSNGGWGILAGRDESPRAVFTGNVNGSTSTLNTRGIGGVFLLNCTADLNAEVGFEGSGAANGCTAEGNGGAGFDGVGLTDCTIVHNGRGLDLMGTARRCTVAENLGRGITGGRLDSCVVQHNTRSGVVDADDVINSWVLGNERRGVVGRSGPSYTTITNSAIRDNVGPGVVRSGRINRSVIYDNDAEGGIDYLEERPSTELQQVDLSGNFWGPVTTPIMDQNPWGMFFNIPAIHDFVDDTLLTEVIYDGHLASDSNVGPGQAAPAFLMSVAVGPLGPDDPVNVGINPFVFTFSEPVDTESTLSVTFGLEPPYSEHVVESAPGWVDALTWRGEFSIQNDTGEGLNTLRVAGALDQVGKPVPDDTAHRFVIETAGGLGANNGLAIAQGTKMNLEWSESGRPAEFLGYNVHRSTTPMPGTFHKINEAPVAEPSFTDEDLEPLTIYYYQVYLVDADNNATQWTPIFFGETGMDNRAESWMGYR